MSLDDSTAHDIYCVAADLRASDPAMAHKIMTAMESASEALGRPMAEITWADINVHIHQTMQGPEGARFVLMLALIMAMTMVQDLTEDLKQQPW